jgi:hypothetical protein
VAATAGAAGRRNRKCLAAAWVAVGGLGDAIKRADLERAQIDIRPRLRERGDHHHRRRPQPHQFLQKIQTVHMRHFDIQRHHIGLQRLDRGARLNAIGAKPHHLDLRVLLQRGGDDPAHRGGIIDDQNAHAHGARPPAATGR